jgi:hypothetical protein
MFQAFKTFFWETEIRGNGGKKTEVTLYIFMRPIVTPLGINQV